MPMFKSTGKLTLASDGSIIYIGKSTREQYMSSYFGLKDFRALSFKKRKIEKAEQDSSDNNEEQEVIVIDDGAQDGNERFTPKKEDLIRVPFRALSATVVAAGTWRATDFTDEAVLRRSIPKIIGKTAFTEHWQYADNCIGVVESGRWGEAKLVDGKKIPAGINIVYLINAKLNEKLASNLLMDPPAIYSNSVTVEFEWEPSHNNFTDEDDFIRNIGQLGPDGRMYARKVTEIIDYHESSILWLGADPFAKLLDEAGNVVNPEIGAAFDQTQGFVKEMYKNNKQYYASYSYKKEAINLTSETETEKTDMEKYLLELARQILGLAADAEVTQAHVDQIKAMKFVQAEEHTRMTEALTKVPKITELEKEIGELKLKGTDSALKTQNESLTTELNKIKGEKSTLEAKVTELEPLSKIGETYISSKRNEVTRLYKASLAKDAKPDDNMLDTFNKADDKQLNSFLTMFTKGVAEKFEAKCKTCGTTEIEFKSTFNPENPDGATGDSKEHLATMVRG